MVVMYMHYGDDLVEHRTREASFATQCTNHSANSMWLNKYFFSNSIISKEQLGFRVGHSTTHVITDVISKLQTYRDNKNFTCLILLDLSKAFDTVDHGILLNKLEKYGVRGNVPNLLKSYLNNRQQVVHIQYTFSVSHYVCCGVLQGSVLGPLLFSIYINDLPKVSSFETRLFADDTVLKLTDSTLKSLYEKVNAELSKVGNWLNSNKLSLNYSKTTYLLIEPKTKANNSTFHNFKVNLKGIKIQKSLSTKYLGVILDENLDWKPHIKCLRTKLSQAVGILAKLRHYLNRKNLVVMYYFFFYSHIIYGILGWCSATDTVLEPIQVLQNKVLRIMNKITWRDRVTNNSLYLSDKILKIADVFKLELGKFMFKYHVRALPEIFNNYFLLLEQIHNYDTRNKCNQNYFLENTIRTNSGKCSIKFCGVKLWTQIPSNLKSSSFHSFKKEYVEILLDQYN